MVDDSRAARKAHQWIQVLENDRDDWKAQAAAISAEKDVEHRFRNTGHNLARSAAKAHVKNQAIIKAQESTIKRQAEDLEIVEVQNEELDEDHTRLRKRVRQVTAVMRRQRQRIIRRDSTIFTYEQVQATLSYAMTLLFSTPWPLMVAGMAYDSNFLVCLLVEHLSSQAGFTDENGYVASSFRNFSPIMMHVAYSRFNTIVHSKKMNAWYQARHRAKDRVKQAGGTIAEATAAVNAIPRPPAPLPFTIVGDVTLVPTAAAAATDLLSAYL